MTIMVLGGGGLLGALAGLTAVAACLAWCAWCLARGGPVLGRCARIFADSLWKKLSRARCAAIEHLALRPVRQQLAEKLQRALLAVLLLERD